jgi:hypothetical protein
MRCNEAMPRAVCLKGLMRWLVVVSKGLQRVCRGGETGQRPGREWRASLGVAEISWRGKGSQEGSEGESVSAVQERKGCLVGRRMDRFPLSLSKAVLQWPFGRTLALSERDPSATIRRLSGIRHSAAWAGRTPPIPIQAAMIGLCAESTCLAIALPPGQKGADRADRA